MPPNLRMIARGNNMRRIKCVIAGKERSGKTQLLQRFIKDTYVDDYKLSNAVHYDEAEINGQTILESWTLPGKECLNARAVQHHYEDVEVILLCCDLTDRESYGALSACLENIDEKTRESVVIGLVGTKADRVGDRVVSDADLEDFKTRNNLNFVITCSAKDGSNIKEVFTTAVQRIQYRESISRDSLHARYKENGGGMIATTNIFGLFNKNANEVILAKMHERARHRPAGASAMTLKGLNQ